MNQHLLDDLNYYNDARVRALDENADFEVLSERGATLVVRLDESIVELLIEAGKRPEDFNGTLEVPFVYEVCPLCQGRGTHKNPSIDCCGLTREDFDDDPDFREDYASNLYDVPCNQCYGKRVVPKIDFPEDVQSTIDSWHASLADSHRISMAEMRAGA